MNLFLAIFSILILTTFLGILLWHVQSLDLILVCLVTVVMCSYDFYISVKSKEKH